MTLVIVWGDEAYLCDRVKICRPGKDKTQLTKVEITAGGKTFTTNMGEFYIVPAQDFKMGGGLK